MLECLALLTKMLHQPFSAESLLAGLPLVNHQLTPELFIRAAARAGLSAKIVKRPLDKTSSLVLPAVLLLNDRQAYVLTGFKDSGTAAIVQPEIGTGVKEIELAELAKVYSGYAIFVQPVHRIRVRTQKRDYRGMENKPLVIIPGMTVIVDILTGQKTVLDYLLKPILKTKEVALRER